MPKRPYGDDLDEDDEDDTESYYDDDDDEPYTAIEHEAVDVPPQVARISYVSDRPISMARGVSLCDTPYIKTLKESNPFVMNDLPPLSEKQRLLDGTYVFQMVYNFRHAIIEGNVDYVTQCLIKLFDLFVAYNRRIKVLIPPGARGIDSLAHIGPFANIHALAVHQFIQLTVLTAFYDIVGMGTPTAILEMYRLWTKYEFLLFCDPYGSLACLVTIGKVLCESYKDGSVFFAMAVYGDNASARKWRQAANENVVALSTCMDLKEFRKAQERLDEPTIKYRHRLRLTMYGTLSIEEIDWWKPILQAKRLRPSHIEQLYSRVKTAIDVYRGIFEPSEPEAAYASYVAQVVAQWCSYLHYGVNNLLGPRSHSLETRKLVFLKLLREYVIHPELREWNLGPDGIFAISVARLASMCEVDRFCVRRIRESQGAVVLELPYGVIGDDGIRKSRALGGGRKAKVVQWNGSMFYASPPVIPKTRSGVFPGVVYDDGLWIPTSLVRINRPVGAAFGYLFKMYMAMLNWKTVKVFKGIDTSERHLDSAYLDFSQGTQVLQV